MTSRSLSLRSITEHVLGPVQSSSRPHTLLYERFVLTASSHILLNFQSVAFTRIQCPLLASLSPRCAWAYRPLLTVWYILRRSRTGDDVFVRHFKVLSQHIPVRNVENQEKPVRRLWNTTTYANHYTLDPPPPRHHFSSNTVRGELQP